ncbi:MAG: cytochrome c maturation protein CcmE [Betaproteobacteria bacterium HGW-Betaproteobacteria-16]|nr:MAG: cytochrome c maturation protein CcmE [Betaproteobacteria bacterium HGW-Betaproteobacteria-16]
MKARNRRFVALAVGLATLAAATALVLNAFNSNLVFFFSPTQVIANEAPRERAFRVGGLVQEGSVVRESQGLTIRFLVTDTAKSIPVTYTGLLPDLFQEGKGVVAQGKLDSEGVFHADQVLAKHDENYMAPEAADALNRAQSSKATPGQTSLVLPEGAKP